LPPKLLPEGHRHPNPVLLIEGAAHTIGERCGLDEGFRQDN
jgi:hypothetical protein